MDYDEDEEITKEEVFTPSDIPDFLTPAYCEDCERRMGRKTKIVQIVVHTFENHYKKIIGYCEDHRV